MERFEKKGFTSSPSFQKFKTIDMTAPANKTKKQLLNQYRDLLYVNQLKTSTIKGYKEYMKTAQSFFGVKKSKEELIKNLKNNPLFSSLYNRMINENGMLEKFKYGVMGTIDDLVEHANTFNEKELYKILQERYDVEYEEKNDDILTGDKLRLKIWGNEEDLF